MQIPSNDGQRAAQAAFEEHENPTKKGGAEKNAFRRIHKVVSRVSKRASSLSLCTNTTHKRKKRTMILTGLLSRTKIGRFWRGKKHL